MYYEVVCPLELRASDASPIKLDLSSVSVIAAVCIHLFDICCGGNKLISYFCLQALPYVILLIAMLFFIYAIIGMQVN